METKLSSILKKIENSKLYEVYSPSEEAENYGRVHRGKYDSREIRNILMSYFLIGDITEETLKSLRVLIDKAKDEDILEFLRNQGDTVVEPISSSRDDMHSLYVHDIDEEHGFDGGW